MKRNIPLIIGNWKMNPQTEAEALMLATAVAKTLKKYPEAVVAVAPSSVHVAAVSKKISKTNLKLAAQDASTEALGPFTGDVSAAQLAEAGVSYVILGHSERRARGENDADVSKKITQALRQRMTPVVCVGEVSRDEHGHFFGIVEQQLRALALGLTAKDMRKVVIAYEPIWAISTTKNAKVATPADAKEMQIFIESILTKLYDRSTARAVRVMYGGSVKPDNILGFHIEGGMNGFLVGGASLKATDFSSIITLTNS